MPAQIIPGLYRLPGVTGVNAYLWHPISGPHCDGAPMLFDCGVPWSGHALTASLVALGAYPEALTTILITHDDIDHVGRLASLYAVSGAIVVAHSVEAPRIAGSAWRTLPGTEGPWGLFVSLENPAIRRMQRQGVRVSLQVEDGALLPGGWLAVHTPGHTPGHTSYYHPSMGILIAGDALGTDGRGRLRSPMAAYCEDPAEAARSIGKLAALEPRVICAGHGPVLYDAAGPLRQFARQQSTASGIQE